MARLAGKVAVITGGAGYIGSATARLFAHEGAAVVCADRAADKLEALVADINAGGGQASGIVTDLTQEDQIARMIDHAVTTYGRLDILHNNASGGTGAGQDGNVVTTPDAEWDWALKINLYATIWGCRNAIPKMLETGGGSIINMASLLYAAGHHELIAMGVTKAAIVALTRYVATSHGKDGIRCNTIAPGFSMDPHRAALLPENFLNIHRQHAMTPRLGIAEDQANTALFLASDESAFMTGQTLHVDGGLGSMNSVSPRTFDGGKGISAFVKK